MSRSTHPIPADGLRSAASSVGELAFELHGDHGCVGLLAAVAGGAAVLAPGTDLPGTTRIEATGATAAIEAILDGGPSSEAMALGLVVAGERWQMPPSSLLTPQDPVEGDGGLEGATGSIALVTTDSPVGDLVWHRRWLDGRVVSCGAALPMEADVVAKLPYEALLGWLGGRIDVADALAREGSDVRGEWLDRFTTVGLLQRDADRLGQLPEEVAAAWSRFARLASALRRADGRR